MKGSVTHPATRYALSFTSGALLTREAQVVAPLYLACRDWRLVREQLRHDNMLQCRTEASGIRIAREVVQRLAVFSDAELELLRDASPSERGHMLWIAACRRYEFIGDFAEEVVRERYLLLKPTLIHDDFDSFVHAKGLWHPELNDLKESTLRKLRSTIFQMLVEAGLLVGDAIVPATISKRVQAELDRQPKTDVRFLPVRQGEV